MVMQRALLNVKELLLLLALAALIGLMCTVLTKLIFRVVFMQARRTYYLRVTITHLSGVSGSVARLEDEI